MPRRDLTEERTTQILDAFERCVARHGLAGTSLEQVAQEADVRRSILRHYVGNREDLIRAMADRFAARYVEQLRQLADYAATPPRIQKLVQCLFPPPDAGRFSEVLLAEALIAAAPEDARIRELMRDVITRSIETVRDVLLTEFPDARRAVAWNVAYGVLGISFNYESLAALDVPARHRRAGIAAARTLIDALGR